MNRTKAAEGLQKTGKRNNMFRGAPNSALSHENIRTKMNRALRAMHGTHPSHVIPYYAVFAVIFLVFAGATGAGQTSESETRRCVTDMDGRMVVLPKQVNRVATIGPIPVLNSFIFAFGGGDKIVNGLAHFARSPNHKYQTLFAPGLAKKPAMQGSVSDPSIEVLLRASPDVIFTMDRRTVDILEKNGFAVVFLSWRQPEDVKRLMRLIGEVLNRQDVAVQYIKYFDETVKRVRGVVARVSPEKRPRVLYCSVRSLTQQHLIAEWWIETAGGVSVTNNGRSIEKFAFSLEQMLLWNPDVLLVSSPEDLRLVYEDQRFWMIKAVKSHRVFVVPMGVHLWANRTIEEPLTLLWAAKTFYPEQFKTLNLSKEVQYFYGRFFHYRMSNQEAREMIDRKR